MTTSEQTLDQEYFEWLLTQVRAQHGSQTYRELCWALYKKQFIWVLEMDDNRVQDGLDLLVEFFHEHGIEAHQHRVTDGCSFLELIIGLSRRCAFLGGGDPVEWAWQLISNLGLAPMSDPLTEKNHQAIEFILERVIWRDYKKNGFGGLFPLGFPEADQRTVELWYQMNAYVDENADPHE
jgi:hypothetical protein